MKMVAVKGCLPVRAPGHLLAVLGIFGVGDFYDHRNPASRWRAGVTDQSARWLDLSLTDDGNDTFDSALEDFARYAIESDFGLIANRQSQDAVLTHPGRKVLTFIGDENHRGSER